ncbi:4407_t:CDS:2 [Entrophospora sp. SA101]|nr:4407_t:CDS:2 [Entrophospora sp. SA101]
MRYDKGNHCGEIYSSYIQKKAKEFVNNSIYKQASSISSIQEKISGMETKIYKMEKKKEITDLQLRSLKMKEVKAKEAKKNNISRLCSSIQKAKNITPNQLQNLIKRMIKENKKQYTPELYSLQPKSGPDRWLSTGTISHWNKEVATLCLCQNCPKDTKSHFYSYGIMCDESTCGDKKIFLLEQSQNVPVDILKNGRPLQESRMLTSDSNKNQVKITKENLAAVRKEQRE